MKNILIVLTLLVSSTFALDYEDFNFAAENWKEAKGNSNSEKAQMYIDNSNYAEFKFHKNGKLYSEVVDYKDKAKLKGYSTTGMSKRQLVKNLYDNSEAVKIDIFMVHGQIGFVNKTSSEVYFIAYESEEAYKAHNILPFKEYFTYMFSKGQCKHVLNDKVMGVSKFEALYNYFNDTFSAHKITGDMIEVQRYDRGIDSMVTFIFYKTLSACEKDHE